MLYTKTKEQLPEPNVRVLAFSYCQHRKEYIPAIAIFIPKDKDSEYPICDPTKELDYSNCHRDSGGYYYKDILAYCHLSGWYECHELGTRLSCMENNPEYWCYPPQDSLN
jgi:hypothetical protein